MPTPRACRSLLAVGFLLVILAPTRADDAGTAEERRLGRASLLGKNYDEAINHFNKALASNPDDVAALIDRAECWSSKGDENRAVGDLTRAIEVEPKNAKARVGRAEFWVEREGDRAIADLDVAIEVDPKNAKAHALRGYARFGRDDLDLASPDFDEAIRLGYGSEMPELFLFRGMLRLSRNDGAGAIRDVDTAIRANPDELGLLLLRGFARFLDKQDEQAIGDCDRYLEARPGDPQTSLLRAVILQRAKRTAEAKQAFDAIIEQNPDDAEALNFRASLALTKGGCAQAIADVERAIVSKPDEVRYMLNRGGIELVNHNYDRALADFARVVNLDPSRLTVAQRANALAFQAWIWATCPEGRFRSGSKAVESARQACELTDWKLASPLTTLSAAYAEVGNFDQAIHFAREAAKLAPKEDSPIEFKVVRFKISISCCISISGPGEDRQVLPEMLGLYQKRRPYRDLR